VIKPFKEKPKLPAGYEDAAWAKLLSSVDAIVAREPVAVGLEDLRQVYTDTPTQSANMAVVATVEHRVVIWR
jgi:hypothetical protein